MNFFKRALCAIGYYKRNTLLLFLIFTILFTMVLSGLCVRQASVDTARQMGIQIGGSVVIESKDEDERGPAGLTLESAEKIAAHPAVQSATFMSSVTANSRRGFTPASARSNYEREEPPPRDQNITLLGCNKVHPTLRDESRIIEGRRPKEGEKGYAVVSSYISTGGFLEVHPGDIITISGSREGEEEIDLEVIGVYYSEVTRPAKNPEGRAVNCLFVDLDTVEAIRGTTNLQGGEFVLKDPAEMPSLLADIEAMGLPDRANFGMISLDGDYQKISISMDTIVTMATLIFWAAIALGAILLTALVMISLSSREFEIGVLLSMGEGRGKVILQLAIETLVPVLLGATAGALLSTRTAVFAAELLGAASRGVEVGIGGWAVGAAYLCGVGLALLASCVTAYKIFTFKPKKLMMAIE